MKTLQPIIPFLRRLLLFLLPLWLLVVLYVLLDPFLVVWHYDNYYYRTGLHPTLDMDYVSCENYVNRDGTHHYNAFIMGNSRSQFWHADDWQRHLGDSAVVCHYYGNGETLYRLTRHLQFIHQQGGSIRHVLLVLDTELLQTTEPETSGHLGLMPPRVDGRLFTFHAENLLSFLKPEFLAGYLDYTLFHQHRPYMTKHFLFEQPVHYNPETNEVQEYLADEAIANGTYYTPERMQRFEGKQFPDSVSPPVIGPRQQELLLQIRNIFRQHNTDCRIVVNPLYNQIRLNPHDHHVLCSLFGTSRVYDFSGPNRWNADYHLYYEDSHYIPAVARQMMDTIYSTNILP
jgi:hypothetical protein